MSYFAKSFATIDAFVYNYEKRNDASITKLQKDNIDAYLKNQYQHLQNWMGILDFFSDKDRPYYQLAVANTSSLMKLNLEWALKYKTKDDFFDNVGLIDDNEDCMKVLGWKENGIKGALLHNYRYMWLKQIFKRSIRSIGRKLGIGTD